MGRNILKNTGRIVFFILFVFLSGSLYPAEIETELSPLRIAVGESASLKLKISGKSTDVKPVKFPALDGLSITFSGSSRSFQFINGRTWSGTVLNFSIYGEKKGVYKIPPFIFESGGERISSREVTLTVNESSNGGGRSGDEGPLRGEVEVSSATVYIGEPFIIRYYVYGGNGVSPRIEGFSEQPQAKGFVMKNIDGEMDEDGKTYAGAFCLVPVEKGVHDIGGGSVEAAVDMNRGFFAMNTRKRIFFPTKKITVIPIPAEGKTDKFSGDVGEFKIETQVPSGKFNLYDEIKIPVKVSGKGNLITLSKPGIENEEGIKTVVEEREQNISVSGGIITGEKNFLITVIPQAINAEGKINPGRIFIEYFNPYKKAYEKTESSPLTFDVQKSVSPGEKGEVQFTSGGSSGNKFNYLYAVFILSGVLLFVVALVLWERKKFNMIRAELRTDLPDEPETYPENKNDDVLKNIQTAMRNNDSEMFLLNADRGINLVDPHKIPPAETAKYNFFKEKIYYCRYGGGVFAEAEMKELGEWLKKNLK